MLWETKDTVLFSKNTECMKIAGFNLYATINKEWDFLFPNTKEKMQKLHREGYAVTYFINRMRCTVTDVFVRRLEMLIRKLSIPVNVYIATEDDIYKKPMTGMWKLCGGNSGFFCGDCGGRRYRRGRTDMNSSDRFFAHNINIPYYTPEEFFGAPQCVYRMKEYPFIPTPMDEPLNWDLFKKETKGRRHIVVIVGCVSFLRDVLVEKIVTMYPKCNYFVANNAIEVKQAVDENRNVIYNARNPRRNTLPPETRHKYSRIVMYYDIPKAMAFHLNEYLMEKHGVKKENPWVYTTYYKNLHPPDEKDGTVITVRPGHVLTDIGREYYYRYDIMKLI